MSESGKFLDEKGNTYVDYSYSKAYLRHLIISKEILGKQIASIHNLGFFVELMNQAREHIKNGDFFEWKNEITKKLDKRL